MEVSGLMTRPIIYPHKVKEANERQAQARDNLRMLLDNHTRTPYCRSCAEDFDKALAEYREKYA